MDYQWKMSFKPDPGKQVQQVMHNFVIRNLFIRNLELGPSNTSETLGITKRLGALDAKLLSLLFLKFQ